MNKNQVSNRSSGQADEILRIKEILHNSKEETDSVLFESLRRLQPLALTVDLLKETEIGKAVNPLKKHSSKEIRQLARTIIVGWKAMVDEWIKSTDSINPSVVDEVTMRQSTPACTDSGPDRQPKSKCSDDLSVQAKLEATKRKLHGSCQQAANAKKQRTIRAMGLHELPESKQGNNGHRNPHSKLWKVLGRRR